MNNKYLLTSIIHNLGIFQPKNYIKYQYSYTIDKVVENKLYLKQLVNKASTKIKQGSSLKVGNNYLFQISKTFTATSYNPHIQQVVTTDLFIYPDEKDKKYSFIETTKTSLEKNNFVENFLKNTSPYGICKLIINNKEEFFNYEKFLTNNEVKLRIKLNTEDKTLNIAYLILIDTANYSGVYVIMSDEKGIYIESNSPFTNVLDYDLEIFNAPYIYNKTIEDDVFKDEKIDDKDPTIIHVLDFGIVVSSNGDSNTTESTTKITGKVSLFFHIKIDDDSLDGGFELQNFIQKELPIVINTITAIDTDELEVNKIRVVDSKIVYNNGLRVIYTVSLEYEESIETLVSSQIKDFNYLVIK
jgi:hypothetical protein